MANSKHLNQVFSNEKQRAILIDRSPNREEASQSLMIMHDMSRDKTRVSLQLEAKLTWRNKWTLRGQVMTSLFLD